MRTFVLRKEDVKRNWWLINCDGKILGRLASEIALILRGKHKPDFTPFVDNGDFVICVNAEKVKLTGKKTQQKIYYSHSGYRGGLKENPFMRMREKKPEWVIYHAVKGMLPKNKLGNRIIRKLKVYKGPNHPHIAQKPQNFEIGG